MVAREAASGAVWRRAGVGLEMSPPGPKVLYGTHVYIAMRGVNSSHLVTPPQKFSRRHDTALGELYKTAIQTFS